jgi:hypothetical protein
VALAGAALWTFGRWEQRAVDARRQLLTLRYEAPAPELDRLERDTAFAGSLPPVGRLRAAIRAQRAESQYWRRDYAPLARGGGDGAPGAGADPQLLLLAANAAYREIAVDGSDRAAPERLAAVIARYGEVLKRDPGLLDAAYNYELAARTREVLARAGAGPSGEHAGHEATDATDTAEAAGPDGQPDAAAGPDGQQAAVAAARPQDAADPDGRQNERQNEEQAAAPGPTIHGQPGRPPMNPDMSEFKIIVPQQPEERQQHPEAGVGGPRQRKG